MCYANAGIFLFGATVNEFQNFSCALSTCFNMLHGDFDWELLGARNRKTAFMYFQAPQPTPF